MGGERIHAFCDHAQNAGIYSVFLCTTYCARVWSNTRCHKRPCPKHRYLQLLRLCTTYCARVWSNTRCYKHPCLWRPCPKHQYLQRICLLVQHIVQVALSFVKKCVKRTHHKKHTKPSKTIVIFDTRSYLMRFCRPCQYFRHFMRLNFAHSTFRGSRQRRKGAQI